jgi:hypothetical protein
VDAIVKDLLSRGNHGGGYLGDGTLWRKACGETIAVGLPFMPAWRFSTSGRASLIARRRRGRIKKNGDG